MTRAKAHLYVRIWRIVYNITKTVGIHLWPFRLHSWKQHIALNKMNHAHFWPRWMLESSKHAPAWQASDERWSLPALPGCLAGFRPRGRAPGWMDLSLALCCPDGALSQRAHHQEGLPPDVSHDWIHQLSFASPWHLWTAWRNKA